MDPLDMNSIIKKTQLPMDPRSTMGIFARGKPVYKGGSNTPNSMNLMAAARNRLMSLRSYK